MAVAKAELELAADNALQRGEFHVVINHYVVSVFS
jgi:hypothetical protein